MLVRIKELDVPPVAVKAYTTQTDAVQFLTDEDVHQREELEAQLKTLKTSNSELEKQISGMKSDSGSQLDKIRKENEEMKSKMEGIVKEKSRLESDLEAKDSAWKNERSEFEK